MNVSPIQPSPPPPSTRIEGAKSSQNVISKIAFSIFFNAPLTLVKSMSSFVRTILSYAPENQMIMYHTSLAWKQMRNYMDPEGNPWWNEVTDHLLLGALPLSNYDHQAILKNEFGVKAVLTLNEDFELVQNGVFSEPTTHEQWESLDVDHLHIVAKDFVPPSLADIDRGVEFIRSHIEKGETVYAHCKAGVGRSAIIVICYFIKYMHLTPEEAHRQVKEKRPLVNMNKEQVDSLEAYFRKYILKLESSHADKDAPLRTSRSLPVLSDRLDNFDILLEELPDNTTESE